MREGTKAETDRLSRRVPPDTTEPSAEATPVFEPGEVDDIAELLNQATARAKLPS